MPMPLSRTETRHSPSVESTEINARKFVGTPVLERIRDQVLEYLRESYGWNGPQTVGRRSTVTSALSPRGPRRDISRYSDSRVGRRFRIPRFMGKFRE